MSVFPMYLPVYLLWQKITDCFLRFDFGSNVVDNSSNVLGYDQPDLILLADLKVVCKSWGGVIECVVSKF